MSYIKVEGHSSLVREQVSNGIINTDKNAYTIYMQRVREARKSNDDLKYQYKKYQIYLFYRLSTDCIQLF